MPSAAAASVTVMPRSATRSSTPHSGYDTSESAGGRGAVAGSGAAALRKRAALRTRRRKTAPSASGEWRDTESSVASASSSSRVTRKARPYAAKASSDERTAGAVMTRRA